MLVVSVVVVRVVVAPWNEAQRKVQQGGLGARSPPRDPPSASYVEAGGSVGRSPPSASQTHLEWR